MSGGESYEALKTSFKETWDEINQILDEGEIEIEPDAKVPIEMFLGGDYKINILLFKIMRTLLRLCNITHLHHFVMSFSFSCL